MRKEGLVTKVQISGRVKSCTMKMKYQLDRSVVKIQDHVITKSHVDHICSLHVLQEFGT